MMPLAAAPTVLDNQTDRASPNAPALIRIQDVFVEYGQPGKLPKRILNGVSLDIRAGEFISIVGQTGCGKSTLLRLVLAVTKPTPGGGVVGGGRRGNAG